MLAKVCTADRARIVEHSGEVYSCAVNRRDWPAVNRTRQWLAIAIAIHPLVFRKILKLAWLAVHKLILGAIG
jgi:hypothetical protein